MKVTIDRIEGTLAVLIPHENESLRFNVPVLLLPPGCEEGDILTLGLERDSAATSAARDRIAGRRETLKKRKYP